MSQKVRQTRKSTDEVEKGEFKTPTKDSPPEKGLENGVTDQKDSKKQQSEPKDGKKQTDTPEKKQVDQQKKNHEQKDQKKPSEQKEQKKPPTKPVEVKDPAETNGKDKELQNGDQSKMVTRSRSTTPQTKKKADNDVSVEETIQEEPSEEPKEETGVQKNGEVNGESSEPELVNGGRNDTEKMEMDTLILTDEPDPELEFDESSDFSESGKGSPVISRCRTRRSQTRNIPTPKTPKSPEDEDSDKTSIITPPSENTDSDVESPKKSKRGRPRKTRSEHDDDSVASDNLSTRAEVGSDTTRLDFTGQDSGVAEDSSFLRQYKERSLAETLRSLSPRRAIRNEDIDYRKQVLLDNQEKFRLSYSFSHHNSVSSSVGVKRKNRSESPEDVKRIKLDSPGIFARLASPLYSIRNKLSRSPLPTSTPKLTGYKENTFASDQMGKIILNGDEDKKNIERKWCSIM